MEKLIYKAKENHQKHLDKCTELRTELSKFDKAILDYETQLTLIPKQDWIPEKGHGAKLLAAQTNLSNAKNKRYLRALKVIRAENILVVESYNLRDAERSLTAVVKSKFPWE